MNVHEIVKRRKPLKIKICNWAFNKRNSKLQEQASRIMAKELDIVYFLRKQLILGLTHKLIFTKLERFLLKNQARHFVNFEVLK